MFGGTFCPGGTNVRGPWSNQGSRPLLYRKLVAMGLIRKITSVSTGGAVKFTSKREAQTKAASAQARAARAEARLLAAQTAAVQRENRAAAREERQERAEERKEAAAEELAAYLAGELPEGHRLSLAAQNLKHAQERADRKAAKHAS